MSYKLCKYKNSLGSAQAIFFYSLMKREDLYTDVFL